MKARMHAFVALMVVSRARGFFQGMPFDKIAATMEKGWAARWASCDCGRAGAMFSARFQEGNRRVDQIAVKMPNFYHNRARNYAIGPAAGFARFRCS